MYKCVTISRDIIKEYSLVTVAFNTRKTETQTSNKFKVISTVLRQAPFGVTTFTT